RQLHLAVGALEVVAVDVQLPLNRTASTRAFVSVGRTERRTDVVPHKARNRLVKVHPQGHLRTLLHRAVLPLLGGFVEAQLQLRLWGLCGWSDGGRSMGRSVNIRRTGTCEASCGSLVDVVDHAGSPPNERMGQLSGPSI